MTTRRSFIKRAGLAAAAVTIVPRHVLGKGYLAPSDKIIVAGIGVAAKGKVILPCSQKVAKPKALVFVRCG
jgi:hypothetical protein